MDYVPDIVMTFLRSTPFVPWMLLTFAFCLFEGATHKQFHWHGRLINALCGVIICCVTLGAFPYTHAMVAAFTHHTNGMVRLPFWPEYQFLSYALAILIYVFVLDLFFYLWHRTEHKIAFLWDIHSVHHSEENLNASSYMRQSWIEGLLQAFFVTLPTLLVVNIADQAQYVASLVVVTWSFFAHADLRLPFGGLTPVFTGPQLHRLHHSTENKHQNSNFAQFFPFWDILFGTYVPPKRTEYPATGLGHGEHIRDVPALVLHPLRQWRKRFMKIRT